MKTRLLSIFLFSLFVVSFVSTLSLPVHAADTLAYILTVDSTETITGSVTYSKTTFNIYYKDGDYIIRNMDETGFFGTGGYFGSKYSSLEDVMSEIKSVKFSGSKTTITGTSIQEQGSNKKVTVNNKLEVTPITDTSASTPATGTAADITSIKKVDGRLVIVSDGNQYDCSLSPENSASLASCIEKAGLVGKTFDMSADAGEGATNVPITAIIEAGYEFSFAETSILATLVKKSATPATSGSGSSGSAASSESSSELILGSLEPEFFQKVETLASEIGTTPEALLTVMSYETIGTLNPAIKNPVSSATGLIQFLEDTAGSYGTTTTDLAKMSRVEQMEYVEKYFSSLKGKAGIGVADLYLSVFSGTSGKCIGKENDCVVYRKSDGDKYTQNSANFDANKDGMITKGEVTTAVVNKYGSMGEKLYALYTVTNKLKECVNVNTGECNKLTQEKKALEDELSFRARKISVASAGTGTTSPSSTTATTTPDVPAYKASYDKATGIYQFTDCTNKEDDKTCTPAKSFASVYEAAAFCINEKKEYCEAGVVSGDGGVLTNTVTKLVAADTDTVVAYYLKMGGAIWGKINDFGSSQYSAISTANALLAELPMYINGGATITTENIEQAKKIQSALQKNGRDINNKIYADQVSKIKDLNTQIEALEAKGTLGDDEKKELAALKKQRSSLETLVVGVKDYTSLLLELSAEDQEIALQGLQCKSDGILGSLFCLISKSHTTKTQVQEEMQEKINELESKCKNNACSGDDYNAELNDFLSKYMAQVGCGSLSECKQKLDEGTLCQGAAKENCEEQAQILEYAFDAVGDYYYVKPSTGFLVFEFLNLKDEAVNALKLFGVEKDYSNVPSLLKEEIPSTVCLLKIDGYLDKEEENGGGVTQYGCELDGDKSSNDDPSCVNVLLDLRAQRTPIAPDNTTVITYSMYLRGSTKSDVQYMIALSYYEDGKKKKYPLSELINLSKGGVASLYHNVIFEVNSTGTVEPNSFEIGVVAVYPDKSVYTSKTYPIVLIEVGDVYTGTTFANSAGNTAAQAQSDPLTTDDMLSLI
ncbi:MAG: YdcH family protein [Candidatus Woesearchaeota archaeon]|nr:MAG: YdcH family protein [Candidatus Woesearchaeota archaeon]